MADGEVCGGNLPVAPRIVPRPDQDERQRILDALHLSRGSRAAAARLLGISRATFYRRLTDLHITLARPEDEGGRVPGGPGSTEEEA